MNVITVLIFLIVVTTCRATQCVAPDEHETSVGKLSHPLNLGSYAEGVVKRAKRWFWSKNKSKRGKKPTKMGGFFDHKEHCKII
uniref:Secreted protein n=1 Tax=Bursaphelenchus xylophilus TaxID=6326 RepID=A0A1I7RUB5_BURXY